MIYHSLNPIWAIDKCELLATLNPLTCEIGVRQGSILGSLLFIIYINDLANVLEHSNISLYADDVILYHYSTSIKDLEGKLNADLLKIGDRFKAHKLTLNIRKTKAMVIGSEKKFRNLISASVKEYDEEKKQFNSAHTLESSLLQI